MKNLTFFLIFIANVSVGQVDELFSQLMENKTYLNIPDRADSSLMARIIADKPETGYAKFCKAYFAYKDGNAELCQGLIDSLLIKHKGLNKFTYVLKGVFYEAFGDVTSALDNYNSALRASPGFILAMSHRGLLYYHTDNLFAAENDFKQILRIKGDDPDFLLNLAVVKLAQNDLDNSFILYKQVADAASGDAGLMSEAYSGMGRAKLLAFEYQESLGHYQNAIKFNPQNGEAYFEMGTIKKYLKDIEGGCQDLITAKQLGVKVSRKEFKGCKRSK